MVLNGLEGVLGNWRCSETILGRFSALLYRIQALRRDDAEEENGGPRRM